MKPYFKKILKIDFNDNLKRKNLIICASVLIVFIIVLQNGINVYKTNLQDINIFEKIERFKPKLFSSNIIYATYGIRLLSSPSPLSSIFPACLWAAHVDTGVGLTIFYDLKRDGIIGEIKGFAGLLTFIILLLSILHGSTAFENRERIKFYESITRKTTFWAILLSRFIQVSILLVGIFIIAGIQCLINGVFVNPGYLAFFAALLEITAFSFLTLGIIFDFFLRKIKFWAALGLFLLSVMFVPWQFDEFMKFRAESFQTELENLKYLSNFENRGSKKLDQWKGFDKTPKNVLIDLIESGQKIEYEQMKANERFLCDKYKSYVRRKHLYASLLPTTFILSVSKELSGSGHTGLIKFNKFSRETRGKFIRHYIQKEYYEKSERGKVVPFPGDHIFVPGPQLPYYTALGAAVSLVTAFILLLIARYGYEHRMVEVPEKKRNALRDLKISLKSLVINYFFTMDDQVIEHVYSEFLHKSGNITINGKPIEDNFIYLPLLKYLPEGVEDLLGIEKDENKDRWEVLLEWAIQRGMVITTWKIYNCSENLKDIIRDGVYLNIGSDYLDSIFGENSLKWEDDESIKSLNIYNLAELLKKFS